MEYHHHLNWHLTPPVTPVRSCSWEPCIVTWPTHGVQQWAQLLRQYLLQLHPTHYGQGSPVTYNEKALSHLHGRPKVRILNFLSIPLPVSRNDESRSEASDAPVQKSWQILHAHRMNHQLAAQGLDSSWWPGVESPASPPKMTPSAPDRLPTESQTQKSPMHPRWQSQTNRNNTLTSSSQVKTTVPRRWIYLISISGGLALNVNLQV